MSTFHRDRHGFHGLNTSVSQRAAQFALRQEINVLVQASNGFEQAKSSALAALAEVEQMPNRLQNADALVSRLPDELLGYIFAIGMAEFSGNESTSRPTSGLTYALATSCVSHSWRRIALSTPLLWTYIIYDYPMMADDIPDPYRLSLYLERSRTEMLDISITYEPRMAGPLSRLMHQLQPHFRRCRRLEFNLSNYTVGYVLPLTGPLEALQTLDVCVSDFSRNVSEQPAVPLRLVDDGQHCHLQSLHLAGPYPFKRSHLNPSRLSRLRYIADGTPFSSVARFAGHFANLRSLEVTIINPPETLTDTYVLPSLQALSIVNVEAFGILRHLDGPALRHLYLWMQVDSERDENISRTFSIRSPLHFPDLRTVSINSSNSQSDLVTANLIANWISAHTFLQGIRLSADVLGLDTLMMLAAIIIDRSRAELVNLRLIRAVLLPPRDGEVMPASTSMYAEIAELLAVFVRCAPSMTIQVQVRRGGGVPGPFLALKESYPMHVHYADTFAKTVAESVDAMDRSRKDQPESDDDTETEISTLRDVNLLSPRV